MPDYTQLNLKHDVENVSERYGLAPDMEARFARNPLGLPGPDGLELLAIGFGEGGETEMLEGFWGE